MSVGFAGSRSLSQRRRRRLATEPGCFADSTSAGDEQPAVSASRDLPLSVVGGSLESVFVPAALWKHCLWGAMAAMLGVAVFMAGHVTEVRDLSNSAGIRYSVTATTNYYNSLLLLVAAQLAWLIWRVRSRSESDFNGRFRLWKWASAAFFCGSVATATGLHQTVGDAAAYGLAHCHFSLHWEFDARLTFGFTAAIVLLLNVHRDMCDCHSSLSMLWLAAVTLIAAVIPQLGGQMAVGTVAAWPTSHFITASFMLGNWFLLMSMLLHARYVVYVSPEPPKLPRGRFSKSLRIARLWSSGRLCTSKTLSRGRNAGSESTPSSDQTPADGPADATVASTARAAAKKSDAGRTARTKSSSAGTKRTSAGTKRASAKSSKTADGKQRDSAPQSRDSANQSSGSESPNRKSTNKESTSKESTSKGRSKQSAPSSRAKSAPDDGQSEIRVTKGTSPTSVTASSPASASASSPSTPLPADKSSDTATKQQSGSSRKTESDGGQAASKTIRRTDPPEKPSLKGLSKKQRRLAMQRWREEMREFQEN